MAQLDEGGTGVTFLDNLQSHRGGLLRLKTKLFWYGGRGWDKNPGRICLLLDATTAETTAATAATAGVAAATAETTAAVHLLIDGSPQWVWVVEEDVELL